MEDTTGTCGALVASTGLQKPIAVSGLDAALLPLDERALTLTLHLAEAIMDSTCLPTKERWQVKYLASLVQELPLGRKLDRPAPAWSTFHREGAAPAVLFYALPWVPACLRFHSSCGRRIRFRAAVTVALALCPAPLAAAWQIGATLDRRRYSRGLPLKLAIVNLLQ